MKFNKTCRYNIDYERTIPYSMYSFIGIVKTYYDLPILVTQRVKFILKAIDTDYHTYFGKIPYENVILGITIFSINEFNNRFVQDSPPLNINEFVVCLWGEDRKCQNITQIYWVSRTIKNLFT